MIQEPAYFAIIPAPVRYDKTLQAAAKLLYGEITALCTLKGYCWAGNAYFADLYGVDKDTVSAWISKLQKAGHIQVVIERSEGNTRRIYLSDKMPIPIPQNTDTYPEKDREVSDKNRIGIGKKQDTYPEKDRHNNKYNNTPTTTEKREGADAPDLSPFDEEHFSKKKKSPSTPDSARPPSPQPEPAKKPPKEHFFRDSPYYEREKFIEALTGTDYGIYDLAFYHETIKNWADSGSSAKYRKADWLATARGFMTRDASDGKPKLRSDLQPLNSHATEKRTTNANRSPKETPAEFAGTIDALLERRYGG